ncbi:MAG: undecaprenyl-diphosphate phosphatase [Ignavibacteriales bacterium]|nr:undecaprenyl-diphosphate phosphatase [Ignavibacteriales bacterium]
MSILQAAILGLLQGLTEFLPVSSSGHLVFFKQLLNVSNPEMLSFDVFVHFGTLISVCIIFRKDIGHIFRSFLEAARTQTWKAAYATNEYFRLGTAIIIASVPAAVVGLIFHDQIAEAFRDPKLVSVNLVVTGLFLFLTRFPVALEGKRVGAVSGFIIGIAQSVAILPGISRSGSTISTALFLHIPPALAARFSFLLSVPVIAGAALLETKTIVHQGAEIGFGPFIVGVVAAAIMGYVSIKLLLRIIERGRFSWFAFYCFVAGIAGILFIS